VEIEIQTEFQSALELVCGSRVKLRLAQVELVYRTSSGRPRRYARIQFPKVSGSDDQEQWQRKRGYEQGSNFTAQEAQRSHDEPF